VVSHFDLHSVGAEQDEHVLGYLQLVEQSGKQFLQLDWSGLGERFSHVLLE